MENKEMNIELVKLKVKVKSLAEEARIIRREEVKLKKIPFNKRGKITRYTFGEHIYDPVNQLDIHRRWDVRNEARATQLAIAYIKGKKCSKIEKSCDEYKRLYYITDRVLKMVQKYHNKNTTREDIKEWFKI